MLAPDLVTNPFPRVWAPPQSEMVKVNFDGSYVHELGRGGIGCVIRNSRGQFLAACSHPVQYAFHVETLACLVGLQLASNQGYRQVILEVKELAQSFHHCSFQHVVRSGNTVADALAHDGLYATSHVRWFGTPPLFLVSSLAADNDL
ncbi:hypothetical protein F3Y22_tig00111277pilonHSYRG00079 [Hibiscus syriacus]|uniref:RNase H type-1 domain-containing protein n=1 Tax=Hibiscus syriacus TaxID=106335 RepID=A0A6A2YSJ2_HIBSY|nr:uncharacterized protein LOC120157871 [Hibiscus syriacus]KAE8682012.1 hypothetical protein F3Y22_tig00111277pilonHSYRG00079 [Hibiscus syriacus]